MKRIFMIIGYLLLGVLALILFGLLYLFVSFPKTVAASAEKIQATPERLKRGEYLVHSISNCIHCHSVQDKNAYSHPVVMGTEGQGEVLVENPELGRVSAPNITPAALSDWTDGEIARAITSGVSKGRRPLFPMMPYQEFAHMTQEDVDSIVVYLRTLRPIQSQVPPTSLKFPMNLIVRTIPQPADPHGSIQNKGEYLATIAGCAFCHTPLDDKRKPIPSKQFAGGHEFHPPGRPVARSANITPDLETGIGKWDKEQFIAKFRRFNSPETRNIPIESGKPNTPMPWVSLSGMTDEDLGAIFDYLKTVPPVRNKVETFGS